MRDESSPNYGCMSCKARGFAQTGRCVDDVESDSLLSIEYRQALERLFGGKWRAGHEKVRDWNQRIRAAAAMSKARST